MDRGIGQVHGSMVDRGAYPFMSSNRGHQCWIRWMGKKEAKATTAVGNTAGLHGGGVTGDRPEWRFGALKLVVRSQGGVGGMAKPVVTSARHWKAGGELTTAWSGR
jgi:hypothetical protein